MRQEIRILYEKTSAKFEEANSNGEDYTDHDYLDNVESIETVPIVKTEKVSKESKKKTKKVTIADVPTKIEVCIIVY